MNEATPKTRFLDRPEGRIGYDLQGHGPLVVLIPGMGDLRRTYRFLVPQLTAAGFRVASLDLRGHGDSDTTFSRYDDESTAGDVSALIDALRGPAVLVGNSLGAAASVLVAAQRPEQVSGLVLIGPFVRQPRISLPTRLLMRVALARPWAALVWRAYLPTLFAGRQPADLPDHLDAVARSMRRPGYSRAFHRTVRQASHEVAERALADVRAPALVIMGEQDPDWPDPRVEAQWIADALSADLELIAEAGHYPQSQQPEATGRAVRAFAQAVTTRA